MVEFYVLLCVAALNEKFKKRSKLPPVSVVKYVQGIVFSQSFN